MPGNPGPALIRTEPTRVVAITGLSASAALGAVTGGSYLQMEPALAQLIAFPSPISIRWGMETLAPRIATALEL